VRRNGAGEGRAARPNDHPALRRTKLKIGETVSLKDGVFGVVLARYTRSSDQNEVRYIVQVKSGEHGTRDR
jgi:hypothetical protein